MVGEMNRRAPRLTTIAKWINAKTNGYTAITEAGYCNTDRKVGRLRWPGKGRTGVKLVVFNRRGKKVFEHNSAETYRCNEEVVDWCDQMWPRLEKPWSK